MGTNNSKNNDKTCKLAKHVNKDLLKMLNITFTPEQTAEFIISLYVNSNIKYKDTSITILNKSISDMLLIMQNPYIKDLELYNPYKKNNAVLAMFLKDIIFIINKSNYDDPKFNFSISCEFLSKLKIPNYIGEMINNHNLINYNENLFKNIKEFPNHSELILLSQSNNYENITNINQDDINKNIDYIRKLIINSILI